MHNHEGVHRRQGRDAFPDPKAIAEAIADAIPNPFAAPEPQRTVVSVVYITASATFDGPIGGYKTLGVGEEIDDEEPETTRTTQAKATTTEAEKTTAATTKKPDPTKEATKASSILVDTSKAEPVKSKQTTLATSTGLPSEITKPSTTLTSSIAIVAATTSATKSANFTKTTPITAAQATASSEALKSEGMSTGGKAGLAIGILLLVGAILAIILFVFKRRKQKAKEEEMNNEKDTIAFAAAGRPASQRTNPRAPRLSLRPVTQFLPNLGEKRASRGNALIAASAVAPQRQQPIMEDSRNNPFSDARAIDSNNANGPSPVQLNGPTGEIIVAAAATGTGAGLARGASKRGEKPKDFTTKGGFMAPPSPSGTEFSQNSEAPGAPGQTASGAAFAAAGGPANSAVHRVQLDFKPSMEDELELRAGQLIRLLHEYDDGWALCIRLDRSQQGVVPRTCLSTRPVKPRPQQPGQGQRSPPGQRGPQGQGQMRPMSPAMNMNGPPRGNPNMSQGPRPESPAGGRYSPAPGQQQRPMTPQGQPRPMTPQGQQRPMTPQGQGRPRSPSVAQYQGQRQSPTGPSPMNPQQAPELSSSPPTVGRKPVPGQAL